ncbi:2-hydroxyhepta-2,4-diene-1,7-dioate isomerase [Micromonospora qiuiae]|uniref:2-hydroxyhepta-2,4-diene-1,7-dioate isomerase n=1 Tax=Micromonospora qiuiae TaxID=502268 RepID=A0ABQ4JIK1_9ACTN|nr:fumarylacetoacetate hydrolase family protein [Micromonospora qiuiae]GIJ30436.1 2-hydroxyhepta-2,4-diene-1,7-dioate isomerase [Micromonospora qiuiae]
MKLMRVGPLGAERPVVRLSEDDHRDLRPITPDIDAGFFRDGGLDRVRRALDSDTLPRTDVTGLRVGAPIARPGSVLCIGMNYAAHAAESGAAPPEHPVLFYKAPNTVVGPNDTVHIPRNSQRTDWEVELAVVMGAPARYLDSPEDAAGLIAGYAISNDVSERAFQLDVSGGQWSKGKSCETFNPLGPWLVTPDEVGDPQALGLRSWINGEPRQDSSTADMIFSVHFLIYHLSQYLVLEPGDLINTGTPEGVALSGRFPYLAPGDHIEMSIDGLGVQRTAVAAAR